MSEPTPSLTRQDAAANETVRLESDDRRPPRDPRNVWRVRAANGWSREVASEGNARTKAAGYDEVCPERECPHHVDHWNGSEWVDTGTVPKAEKSAARYEGWFVRLCCEACGEMFEVEDDVSNGQAVTCDACGADLEVERFGV